MQTQAARPRTGAAHPDVTAALAVVAHPDDESFGLGALITALTDRAVPVWVLSFTRGEASTLHDHPGDLAAIRADELRAAATVLGVDRVELLDHPDGALAGVDLATLTAPVLAMIGQLRPSHLLVFDQGGITGHPDHVRATEAALAAATTAGLPLLAWALPHEVATRLNHEFGTAFAGRRPDELDQPVPVDRDRQRLAIASHRSQSTDNPVLRRRIELLADTEQTRLLYQPAPPTRH
mgnify:CR=1 FL=1